MKRNPNEVHSTTIRRKIEMFCRKCGVQIAEGAAFCHKCGAKVVYEETSPQLAKQGAVSTAAVASIPIHSPNLSLIHIADPTRQIGRAYAVL